MLRAVKRKPVISYATYKKYGFVPVLHQYCNCPRCGRLLNAGPSYQPDRCDLCGQRIRYSGIIFKEDVELECVGGTYEPIQN
jgi:tRNA(Ile2) C34 agmatinyltransferase TiaS